MIIHGGFMEIGGVLGMIPAGIMDGSALILILMQYYGDKKIINE